MSSQLAPVSPAPVEVLAQNRHHDVMRKSSVWLLVVVSFLAACSGQSASPSESEGDLSTEQETPTENVPEESSEFRFVEVDVDPISGSGNDTIVLEVPVDFPAIVEMSGSPDLALLTLDENGEDRFLEDNFFKDQESDYRGVYLIGVNSEVHGFQILSEGDWTLHLKSANEAKIIEPGSVVSGTDNDVFRFREFTQSIIPIRVVAGPDADRFTLSAEGGNPVDLLDGIKTEFDRSDLVLPTETIIVVVESYGSWELEIG